MFYDWVVSIHFTTYDQKAVTIVFETPSHWMLKILEHHGTKENTDELLFPDIFPKPVPFYLWSCALRYQGLHVLEVAWSKNSPLFFLQMLKACLFGKILSFKV